MSKTINGLKKSDFGSGAMVKSSLVNIEHPNSIGEDSVIII